MGRALSYWMSSTLPREMTMNRKSYLDEAQNASLKDVMAQPPMTLRDYQTVQERRVALRRQMEDMRLRRVLDESE